jgi:RHS repeat-associated protein
MLQTSTSQSGMYVYGVQGNPVSLTTEGSATSYLDEFDPYGGAMTTQNSGGTGYVQHPYVYGGGLQDRSTGLIKFGQRWYDLSTGSRVQQDILNAHLDPLNANRYSYANRNPVNYSAPPAGGSNSMEDYEARRRTGHILPRCTQAREGVPQEKCSRGRRSGLSLVASRVLQQSSRTRASTGANSRSFVGGTLPCATAAAGSPTRGRPFSPLVAPVKKHLLST